MVAVPDIGNLRRAALIGGYIALHVLAFVALGLAGGVGFSLLLVSVLVSLELLYFGLLRDESLLLFLYVDAAWHIMGALGMALKFEVLPSSICVVLFAGLKLALFLGLQPEGFITSVIANWLERSRPRSFDFRGGKIGWEDEDEEEWEEEDEDVPQRPQFVDIPQERCFVEEDRFGTCDPLDGTRLCRGETVVVCNNCRQGYHESSWKYVEEEMGGKCLSCHQTRVATSRMRL